MNAAHCLRTRIQAFTLVECLVALLIFGTALSALAANQLAGKRLGGDALHRSLATGLALGIIEQMVANPGQVQRYRTDDAGSAQSTIASPVVDCGVQLCSPAELADFDLWRWERALLGFAEVSRHGPEGGLPSPRGCISVQGGYVTVAISWLGAGRARESALSTCGANEPGLYDARGQQAGNNLRRRQTSLSRYIGAGP